MKTMSVGELKSNFSEVLKNVEAGDCIGISFGKKKEKLSLFPTKNMRDHIKKGN